ncbi:MAG: endonuclease NucS [Pseudomonadota bacterium]|nr:endonuclease NucS [Pseudomonadota bacterium]
MPTEMKLWQINNQRPVSIPKQKLDFESRLEEWLWHDINLINSDLLVIGQQVETAYGGIIDLLSLDHVGNLVVLELKRDKTPRDIVTQTLDYASWIQDLGHETINELANRFLKGKNLEQAFREKFQTDLPEVLNERHRMFIVASSIDSATERIVKYLSETHDVDINVATFAYFKTEQGEFLGRSMLLDENEVQSRGESKSKRKPPRSLEELRGFAEKSGVIELYDKALLELNPLFGGMNRTLTNVAFVGYMGDKKVRNVIVSIFPRESTSSKGLVMKFYFDRLCQYFNISKEQITSLLGSQAEETQIDEPNSTWFFNSELLESLINLLNAQ